MDFGTLQAFKSITSYAFDFAPPMKSLNILNSIGNNQNNVWDKSVYLPIKDKRSYDIASNDESRNTGMISFTKTKKHSYQLCHGTARFAVLFSYGVNRFSQFLKIEE